jgi:hypothetical protein
MNRFNKTKFLVAGMVLAFSLASCTNQAAAPVGVQDGLCGFGEVDARYGDACLSPNGLVFQQNGYSRKDAFTNVADGVYYTQFVIKNGTGSPMSATISSQLTTEDGATYNALPTDDFSNPGGLCETSYSTWSVNLNPDAFSRIGACFAVPAGTHVTQIKGVDENGDLAFSLNVDTFLK